MIKKNKTKKKNVNARKKYERTFESFEIIKSKTYTVAQLADWWQLKSTSTVLNAIRNNGLKASRIGQSYSILGKDALKYHESMRVYRR